MMNASSYEALSALLMKLFDSRDLRLFIRHNYGDSVFRRLPGGGVSLFELVHDLVRLMDQHGYVGDEFFDRLKQIRPMATEHIEAISALWRADGAPPRPQIQNQIADTVPRVVRFRRTGWAVSIFVVILIYIYMRTWGARQLLLSVDVISAEKEVAGPVPTAVIPFLTDLRKQEDWRFVKYQNAVLSWALQKRKAVDLFCRAKAGQCARTMEQAMDSMDDKGIQAFLDGCQPSFENRQSAEAISLPHGYIVLCPARRPVRRGGMSCTGRVSCFKLWLDCGGQWSCNDDQAGVGCVDGSCIVL